MAESKQKILDFLERVIEIEKTVYVLDELESQLQVRIDTLGKSHNIPYPTEEYSSLKECFWMSSSGGMVLGMIIGGISGFFGVEGFFSVIFNVFLSGFGGIFIGGFIGVILTPLWYLIGKAMANSRLNAAMEERAVKVRHDQARVQQEQVQIKQLQSALQAVKAKKQKTKDLRTSFYEQGPIYKDYQDIVPVCSFYQYLQSGKCDTLTGYEGAYRLYDHERRLDLIVSLLVDIKRDLEQIKKYQLHLYNTIQAGNQKIDTLLRETMRQSSMLEACKEQSAIIAYNSEITNRELAHANWLKTYELTKKGY